MDNDKAPQWCPTLIEFETLSGRQEQAGSVHTCLHGDIGKVVHYRVAYDGSGRRSTDKLTHIPVVEQALQTIELKPSAVGTKATIYYSLKPPAALVKDEKTLSLVLDATRQRSENDLRGLKTLCEAEARASKRS